MAFYESAPGFVAEHYGAYPQKQTNYWRYIIVSVLVLGAVGAGAIVTKALGSVEQANSGLPRYSFAAASAPETREILAAAAVQDRRSPELKGALEAWVAAQKGSEWSFDIHSLENDELNVGVNEATQFELASIYKLFLLRPLAQKIPVEAWPNTFVTSRTYADCVDAMLSLSDNPCAEAIAGKLGWSSLHRQIKADGYKNTDFNRTDYLAGTAADTGLLLDRLYHGDGYSAKTKELALAAMVKTRGSQAIRKACVSCTVYNKTGEINGVHHDAAIVVKDGHAYVLVIFSKGASWTQMVEAATIVTNHL